MSKLPAAPVPTVKVFGSKVVEVEMEDWSNLKSVARILIPPPSRLP